MPKKSQINEYGDGNRSSMLLACQQGFFFHMKLKVELILRSTKNVGLAHIIYLTAHMLDSLLG